VNGTHKIRAEHRTRAALVYLRQSTLMQVRENTESTLRQYALAGQAVTLGWAQADVEVIDTDLGMSGTTTRNRAGYARLVSRVCLGEVGAIFGLEISRLARSNADLARLAELARLTDTLLIDADGIYDLSDVNDRLVLGFKSAMSEIELHVMARRLQDSREAAARRGELRAPLPVGLVYDADGDTIIDPDQEVSAAVADVFAAFTAAGSAYAVVQAFAGRRFPLRAYGGAWAGQLRWGTLTAARVQEVLHNPAYAGAYAFGRTTSRKSVQPDGTIQAHTVALPRQQWPVLIKDHHPGYITWQDYLSIEARLAANRTSTGQRPPREGRALCQGIIFCGSCGRAMATRHHRPGQTAYECKAYNFKAGTPTCRSIAAGTVDDAVADALLTTLRPGQIALALAAAGQIADRHQRATRAAELAADRARYDASRAERAFHACEPENRLVARTLEARWESRLNALAEAEAALAATRDTLPPLPSPDRLTALAADLPGLWHAPTTSDKDRKRLLRTLIADIHLLPEPDPARARIGIRWHTGATDELSVSRTGRRFANRTPQAVIDLVRRQHPGTSDDDLITQLNTAGLTTGLGRPFSVTALQRLRYAYNIPAPAALARHELTVSQVADQLNCSINVIYYWIKTGQLPARKGRGNRRCIPWDSNIQARYEQRIAASSHLNPVTKPSTPARGSP